MTGLAGRGPSPQDTSLQEFLELMSGHGIVRCIGVIAELGVADALDEGSRSVAEIARLCGAEPNALGRVMRLLAAVGVFSETADPPVYGLTPISLLLRSDAERSLRGFARLRGGSMSWGAWAGLEHAVRTGDSGFEHIHGSSAFEHMKNNPADAKVFDEGMRSLSNQIAASVVASYDFSPFHRVMDVGGGWGGLLAEILRANPGLAGTLVDLPSVLAGCSEVLRSAGVEERCTAVAGDFFDPLPRGADVVILSHVLHNWSDADALRILRNCRDAIGSGHTVLVLEYALTDGAAGVIAKQFDLQMLVYFGAGR
ncbi:MAG: methyltransferase, partial [Pseudomonadota bacterium]